MKELGLIIDLNQSPIQEESAVKKSVLDFYNPLIRLLKLYKNITVSLNVPLSVLELWDKYGYASLISEIKELYQNDRVEILNSSPYNLPLAGLPKNIIESQIVLNEYGIGYYLGSTQGFEGEPSIMLRDISGFLPSYFSLDVNVLKTLDDFGYKWVAIVASDEKKDVFEIEGVEIKVVSISDDLNKLICPKEIPGETDVASGEKSISIKIRELIKDMDSNPESNMFKISVTEEGYINKNTLNNLETVFDVLSKSSFSIRSVGEIVKSRNKFSEYELNSTLRRVSEGSLFEKGSYDKFLSITKDIRNMMSDSLSLFSVGYNKYELEPIKMWSNDIINSISDNSLRSNSHLLVAFSKILPFISHKYLKDMSENKTMTDEMEDFSEDFKIYCSKLLSYIDDDETKKLFESIV